MTYVVDLHYIADDYSATIDEIPMQSVDGIVVKQSSDYHIVVNSSLSPYAKQWTIAHEIGHIFDESV